MPARVYRPRAALSLTVPLRQGDDLQAFTYTVPVQRFHHTLNDHNHADTLSCSVDWIDAGVDPRWIAGATCEFYLGNASEDDHWQPNEDDIRFVGRMVKPSRAMAGEKLTVDLEFHDYTSFFLLAKPLATDGVPLYTDDLKQAWARLCQNVPGAEELADNIVFEGLDGVPKLGDSVLERFRKAGKLQVSPQMDAWAVWQLAVGAAGLISYFRLDQCVVTTALDYYTAGAPPRFVYGQNLLSFSEQRNNDFAMRAVGLTSFDPITGKTIEVIHDPLHKSIKVGAKKRGKNGKAPKVKTDLSQVDFFQYPGVTDEAALRRIAEGVYEVRSRQAIEGTLTTVDMDTERAGGGGFDLLTLQSGDLIEVRFLDTDDVEFVKVFDSVDDRADYLEGKGYTSEVARIIATNVDYHTKRSAQFYVRSVEIEGDFVGEGNFKITVNYINKIDPKMGEVATGEQKKSGDNATKEQKK
jgi:hypothetical protein